MTALQVWTNPKQPFGHYLQRGLDDTNTPYVTTRRAFRQCSAGVLRLHAAETLFRPKMEEWNALVLHSPSGEERAWFYRDEARCREVYAAWAGHGDPEDFDFSFEAYAHTQDRPELALADVLQNANPLHVHLPR